MRKKAVPKKDKSLRTFVLYMGIVLILILISLTVKIFTIYQHSKFDGVHSFSVAIGKNDTIEKIAFFNPTSDSVNVLTFEGGTIPAKELTQKLSLAIDGEIDEKGTLDDSEISSILRHNIFHYSLIKTNVTIIDLARLYFFSQNVSNINKKELVYNLQDSETDLNKLFTQYFRDDQIALEKIGIQIVNATGEPGVGKRMEKLITNMGGNVVAVTTSQTGEPKSKIQYYGSEETYTLTRLQRYLRYPLSKLNNKTIADIVIIIGKNSVDTGKF